MTFVVGSEETQLGFVNQFAKVVHNVLAVDMDPVKIEYLMNNASIYGVEKHITPITYSIEALSKFETDFSFISPAWGGINYINSIKYKASVSHKKPIKAKSSTMF